MRTWALPLVVVLLLNVSGCGRYPTDPIFARDHATTAAEVAKIIPVGSTVAFAQATLEKKTFQCSMRFKATYPILDPENRARKYQSEPADFLWCRSEKATGFLVTTTWQVFVEIKNDAVTYVAADIYANGL